MQLASKRSFTHSKFASLDAGHTIYVYVYVYVWYYIILYVNSQLASAPRISIEAFRPGQANLQGVNNRLHARRSWPASTTTTATKTRSVIGIGIGIGIGVHWPRFSALTVLIKLRFISFFLILCMRSSDQMVQRSCSGSNAIEFCSSEDESRPLGGYCSASLS